MKAIVLAAGRGSRLGAMTDQRPKCLVELDRRPLLRWQAAALAAAGVERVTVVTGYRRESIEALGYATHNNPDWDKTNMVGSLWSARSLIDGPTIISYSDIVYGAGVIHALAASDASLAVAYDTDWLQLWQQRFANPLDDAESLRLGAGRQILDIGRNVTSLDEIEGQYLGLIRVTPESIEWMADLFRREPTLIATLSMTDLLRTLIREGHFVAGVETSGHWCEVDTPADLAVAERLVARGEIVFPTVPVRSS